MSFLAPAVPWIIKGGSALLGGLLGKKAQSSAQARSPEEAAALGGAQQAGGGLMNQGKTLTAAGLPAVTGASNYWQTLLGGNRSAMALATAGPRAALTSQYAGAQKGLEASGVRGAERDLLKGEMSRDKASQIASLTTGVQPAAASALGSLGTNLTAQGTAAYGNAGNLYGNLLNQGMQNRVYARDQGQQAGQAIGSSIFDILNAPWKRGGGGSVLPSSSTVPNIGTLPMGF